MKKIIPFVLFAFTINSVHAQLEWPDHEWKASLTVVDEDGKPVSGAQVTIGYNVTPLPGERIAEGKIIGLTDTNGVFIASHRDKAYGLGFLIEKSGYYQTRVNHGFGIKYVPGKWNPTLTLVLKKIGEPIPMYAKWVRNGPPVFNEPIGYDLMAGDWVAPHGKGQTADVIFNGKLDKKAKNDFDYKLTISFPNSGDGIQQFKRPDDGSQFESPREAPASGYLPSVIRTMSRHPNQWNQDDSDRTRNYFIRVRTVLDEKGNVKSALYGKIYGDFMDFQYFLNPEPNSRNLEFDSGRNLAKHLKSLEEVVGP